MAAARLADDRVTVLEIQPSITKPDTYPAKAEVIVH